MYRRRVLPAGSLRRHLRTVAVCWSEGASGTLTIALLEANDAHWKERRDEAVRGPAGERRKRAGIRTTGLGREKPRTERAGCGGEAGTNVGVDRPTRKIQMRSPGALPTGEEARQRPD